MMRKRKKDKHMMQENSDSTSNMADKSKHLNSLFAGIKPEEKHIQEL